MIREGAPGEPRPPADPAIIVADGEEVCGEMGIEFIAAIAIVTLAGVVSGLVGFGFALVCVPPLLLIYDPPVAITVSVGLTLPTGWVILIGVWRQTFGDKGSGR